MLEQLYQGLFSDGHFTGSFQDFQSKMEDPEDGNDTFRITMPDGTSKVFTADPFTGDKRKIKEAWDWINSNYVNIEFK